MSVSVTFTRAHHPCGREKTGSLNTTLTATMAKAFFAADPSATDAVIGANMLFDPDAPEGNYMALKAVSRRPPRLRSQCTAQASGRPQAPAVCANRCRC